jgi:hypothetical protein
VATIGPRRGRSRGRQLDREAIRPVSVNAIARISRAFRARVSRKPSALYEGDNRASEVKRRAGDGCGGGGVLSRPETNLGI